MTLTPDICIIGGGSGGLTVAAAAAAFGVSVVLVEKGLMGGDCLNYGCVPSKALLAAARHAEIMRTGAAFGIAPVEPEIDFAAVRDHIRGVIASIAPNDSAERFEGLGVRVVKAAAHFADRETVEAGGLSIRARRFVVATGSSPSIPPVPGLETVPYLTNETIFDLAERPRHLAILGGGPIGVELAQAFRRLGSAVTLFEAGAALGREETDLRRIVLDRLRAEGVVLHEETRVSRVEAGGEGGILLHAEGPGIAAPVGATHLLVAAGRRVNSAGLGLEAAGIAFDGKGIAVTPALRTTNPKVYALGDCAGGPQFTHAATYQASLVVRQILFRLPVRQRPAIIPRVTYTDPEIAHVGLGRAEAGQAVRKVLDWPLARNDRAEAERRTYGMIRIVTGKGGIILGVSIVAPQAGEMIHLWADAVARRAKIRDMLAYVPPYPTTGEIGRRAAITAYDGAAKTPIVRMAVSLLRRFG